MSLPLEPDAELEQALQLATGHHVAGRLEAAGAGYRQVLAGHPGHPVALHRLGILMLQGGQAQVREPEAGKAQRPAAWRRRRQGRPP